MKYRAGRKLYSVQQWRLNKYLGIARADSEALQGAQERKISSSSILRYAVVAFLCTVGFQLAVGQRAVPFTRSGNGSFRPRFLSTTVGYRVLLGGREFDRANAIAVDSEENVVIVGETGSTDFPTKNAFQPTCTIGSLQSCSDGFVLKLSGQDGGLIYSSFFGLSGNDAINDVAVGVEGDVFLAGTVERGESDAFIKRLNAQGQPSGFTRYFGGGQDDFGQAIAVDTLGNSYITGTTLSEDLPVLGGYQDETGGGNLLPEGFPTDVFVSKFGPAGKLIFSTYLGGNGLDHGHSIVVDSMNHIYVAGETRSTNFPLVNAFQTVYGGGSPRSLGEPGGGDAFIAKMNPSGNALLFSTFFGGPADERGSGISTGPGETVHVSIDGDPRLLSLSSNGSLLLEVGEGGNSLAVDKYGASYVCDFQSVGMVSPGGHSLGWIHPDQHGLTDLLREGEIRDLAVDSSLNIFIAGLSGNLDAFVVKFAAPDQDGDGIPDSPEGAAPNQGDGNWDGKPDFLQAEVASFPGPNRDQFLTVQVSEESSLADVYTADVSEYPSPPDGVVFPLGLFGFSVSTPNVGSAITVSVLFPQNTGIGAFYNLGTNPDNGSPRWYRFDHEGGTGAEVLSDRVLLHLVDGGPGDEDLAANGKVTLFGGPAQEQISFYLPQLADGIAGNIRFQSTLILANTGADTAVQVKLFSSPDGDPMEVELGGLGEDSAFSINLSRGASISLSISGERPIRVGYARIRCGEGVSGLIVFSRSDLSKGIQVTETGVPATDLLQEFSLVVDSIGDRNTGVAMVYPRVESTSPAAQTSANLIIRLYDESYNEIAEQSMAPLLPGQHLARFVHELFDDPAVRILAEEMRGLLTIESDQPLAALTLRQSDAADKEFPEEVPTLTTFPVIPGRPDSQDQ